MKLLISVFTFLIFSLGIYAQENKEAIRTPINTLLETISSEARSTSGEKLLDIFTPTARLSILNKGNTFEQKVETISPKEFIELLKDEGYEGFTEVELGFTYEEFAGLAQVFQAFEAREKDGNVGRGVNSYQLVQINGEWKIHNILWTNIDSETEIPKKYLQR